MLHSLLIPICWGLASQTAASPFNSQNDKLSPRATASTSAAPYSLPSNAANKTARADAIQVKRDTFLYGTSIAGNVSYWPTGSLGNSTTENDLAELLETAIPQAEAETNDSSSVIKTLTNDGGFKSLSDFKLLYEDQWKTSFPDGLDSGVLTNYTNDLMFSMERLSTNPYVIRRMNPSEVIEFVVNDTIATKLTGSTVQGLLKAGRLFYADHRYQATLPSTGRYAAACDAYFYINETSGNFLPLAIRTNVGSNLIYTPADAANDWLLAKMMFNVNDFFHSQWWHFAGTHDVVEIVYEAAYRTLSDDHPVMALLKRLTPQLFSFRQAAVTDLFAEGAYVDQLFAYTGTGASQMTSDLYNTFGAGPFVSNYLYTDVVARGLLHCKFGPALKHFPFLEDASPIQASIRAFMRSFVESYYPDTASFQGDSELQAWIAEAVPAKIMDFPTSVNHDVLVDMLTHVAFLCSAEHQALNTNDISEVSGSLPFHPFSLYQPVPAEKGVTDIVPFLPNVTQATKQIALTLLFARPAFVNSSVSLTQMFNDTDMLGRMNGKVQKAAALFESEMVNRSAVVRSRKFDSEGLSQGMPFIWRALDPERAPFYLAI